MPFKYLLTCRSFNFQNLPRSEILFCLQGELDYHDFIDTGEDKSPQY